MRVRLEKWDEQQGRINLQRLPLNKWQEGVLAGACLTLKGGTNERKEPEGIDTKYTREVSRRDDGFQRARSDGKQEEHL